MLLTNYEKRDMPDAEPIFELYNKERTEFPDSLQKAEQQGRINTNDLIPDERIRGYENTIEFIESHQEPYIWNETGTTKQRTVCTECTYTVHTNSKERLHQLRATHRQNTGQHLKLPAPE